MTFVELSPVVMVDPAEVALLAGDATGTRIYLRGGAGAWIGVDRPLADVVAALAGAA